MANVHPKDIQFLLADAVRQESGGKLTLLGFYSGHTVILQDPIPKDIPDHVHGIALPGLTIVATIFDGHGMFDGQFCLFSPSGIPLGKGETAPIEKQKNVPSNLIFPIHPFPVPEFGTYRIVLKLNRHEHEFAFKVAHVDPKACLPKRPESAVRTPKKALPKRGQKK